MTMLVQATTDDVPGLAELIERRQALGQDTYDECWDGVYRIVPAPGRGHGRTVLRLGGLLDPRAAAVGLQVAAPVNIGIDKVDFRVPDLGIVHPDVEMRSGAFHATAELVVETMSPAEKRGEKLPFYATWNVKEYLEVDPGAGTVRLLRNVDGDWQEVDRSAVIDLAVGDVRTVLDSLD